MENKTQQEVDLFYTCASCNKIGEKTFHYSRIYSDTKKYRWGYICQNCFVSYQVYEFKELLNTLNFKIESLKESNEKLVEENAKFISDVNNLTLYKILLNKFKK